MMDLQALMGMIGGQGSAPRAPEAGGSTLPLNAAPAMPAGMDKNALLQMLLQMLMQGMGQQGQPQGGMPQQAMPQQMPGQAPPTQY